MRVVRSGRLVGWLVGNETEKELPSIYIYSSRLFIYIYKCLSLRIYCSLVMNNNESHLISILYLLAAK